MFEFDVTGEVGGMQVAAAGSVRAGECLLITGPSGSGKTTLVRMLAGLHPITSGTVNLGGVEWQEASGPVPVESRKVGFVFQNLALFPRMSALGNVMFGMPTSGGSAQALELLDSLGLAKQAHERASTLSGGEQQRVAIARALASGPDLLLLDEPFTALDAATAELTSQVVAKTISDHSIPAVAVTHALPPALPIAAEAIRIEAGVAGTAVNATNAF